MKSKNEIDPLERRTLLSVVAGDFNGDGIEDLVIGVPEESLADNQGTPEALESAGVVHVLYGQSEGASVEGNQLWQLRSPGIKGEPKANDRFGNALASGDFDDDGFDDLAIGIDGQSVRGLVRAGAVLVLYGSEDGLTVDRAQRITQDSKGIPGFVEENDLFGNVLAADDFDGDGFADLAISAPGESVGESIRAGAVNIVHGSGSGLRTATRSQLWNQDVEGIRGTAGSADLFGSALATGDFDDNGRADLAIGSTNDKGGNVLQAGSVNILYGRKVGLKATGDQLFSQASPGVSGTPELRDRFGAALAAGDFDDDGFDDLAIGAPGENFVPTPGESSGIVHIIAGSADRLVADANTITSDDLASQLVPIIGALGTSLGIGDFNGDNADDLAIGAPTSPYNDKLYAGSVHVIQSSEDGPDIPGAGTWIQSLLDDRESEFGDGFGDTVAAGDLNGDQIDDLIAVAPFEDIEGVDSIPSAGSVDVIYGTLNGLSGNGSEFFDQDTPGIPGLNEDGDQIGKHDLVYDLIET